MEEYWSIIPEAPMYEIDNRGRVRNRETEKFLTAYPNTRGYPKVSMRVDGHSITRSVHGLVARAFLSGGDNDLEPNHIDGDKLNNAVENLEWTTHRENMLHASRTGLFKNHRGHSHIPVRIIETGEYFESIEACARAINGLGSCICQCIQGRQRAHKGYTFELA
jgi:hypothetical protein